MLSGVTRGACPPVYLDKATGTRTQLRRGHAGETHAYIRLWKYFDWFLSQCIRGSRRLTALNLHVWLEQISQAPPPPLFTAWTCTFWVTSKKKQPPYSNCSDDVEMSLLHCGDVTEAEYWPFKCTTVDVEAHYSSNMMTRHHSPWFSVFLEFIAWERYN